MMQVCACDPLSIRQSNGSCIIYFSYFSKKNNFLMLAFLQLLFGTSYP